MLASDDPSDSLPFASLSPKFRGLWTQAEHPAVDGNGWFATGDVSSIDEHGCMKVRPALANGTYERRRAACVILLRVCA